MVFDSTVSTGTTITTLLLTTTDDNRFDSMRTGSVVTRFPLTGMTTELMCVRVTTTRTGSTPPRSNHRWGGGRVVVDNIKTHTT